MYKQSATYCFKANTILSTLTPRALQLQTSILFFFSRDVPLLHKRFFSHATFLPKWLTVDICWI